MTKTVAVLGSTGSIGRQTLQVVQELGLTVAALTANRQVDLLEQQARQLHISANIAIWDLNVLEHQLHGQEFSH